MSKIEQIISEIEEYIDGCKFQPLSSSKIIVNKEEIDELLSELRLRTPEEIKKYQKIIINKDAILKDAKEKADAMIADANKLTTTLISEHEIMQQAYVQANEVIHNATEQAREILDKATSEANDVRTAAIQYTDSILEDIQNILMVNIQESTLRNNNLIEAVNARHNEMVMETSARHESLMEVMNKTLEVVTYNRQELNSSQNIEEEINDQTEELDYSFENFTVDIEVEEE